MKLTKELFCRHYNEENLNAEHQPWEILNQTSYKPTRLISYENLTPSDIKMVEKQLLFDQTNKIWLVKRVKET